MARSTHKTSGGRLRRIWRRGRDLLLALPIMTIGVTVADTLAHPERPGPATWLALCGSGAAIALYLAFPPRDEDRS